MHAKRKINCIVCSTEFLVLLSILLCAFLSDVHHIYKQTCSEEDKSRQRRKLNMLLRQLGRKKSKDRLLETISQHRKLSSKSNEVCEMQGS